MRTLLFILLTSFITIPGGAQAPMVFYWEKEKTTQEFPKELSRILATSDNKNNLYTLEVREHSHDQLFDIIVLVSNKKSVITNDPEACALFLNVNKKEMEWLNQLLNNMLSEEGPNAKYVFHTIPSSKVPGI